MYDINKVKHGSIVTVGEVIEALSEFDKDADFLLDGYDEIFIHCNDDGSSVNMSTEDLIDGYEIPNESDLDKELYKFNFGGSLYNDMIEVKMISKSGKEITRLIKEEDFKNESLSVLPIYYSYLKSSDPEENVDRDQLTLTGTRFSYFKGWYNEEVKNEDCSD